MASIKYPSMLKLATDRQTDHVLPDVRESSATKQWTEVLEYPRVDAAASHQRVRPVAERFERAPAAIHPNVAFREFNPATRPCHAPQLGDDAWPLLGRQRCDEEALMDEIETGIGERQSFEYVAWDEDVVRRARSRHGGTGIRGWGNNIDTDDVSFGKHQRHFHWPAPRPASHVENIARVGNGARYCP